MKSENKDDIFSSEEQLSEDENQSEKFPFNIL